MYTYCMYTLTIFTDLPNIYIRVHTHSKSVAMKYHCDYGNIIRHSKQYEAAAIPEKSVPVCLSDQKTNIIEN